MEKPSISFSNDLFLMICKNLFENCKIIQRFFISPIRTKGTTALQATVHYLLLTWVMTHKIGFFFIIFLFSSKGRRKRNPFPCSSDIKVSVNNGPSGHCGKSEELKWKITGGVRELFFATITFSAISKIFFFHTFSMFAYHDFCYHLDGKNPAVVAAVVTISTTNERIYSSKVTFIHGLFLSGGGFLDATATCRESLQFLNSVKMNSSFVI